MLKNNWQFWRKWGHTGEHPELFRPGRDWRVILALAGLFLIFLISAYFWINRQINNLTESQASESASGITARFTREDLEKYAGDLETRQARFDLLKNSPETFADPSL